MSKNLVLIFVTILVGVILWILVGAFSRADKTVQIETSVGEIQFSGEIKKRQCGGGGIDTSEWCTYIVEAPLASVVRDLTAAGYSAVSQSSEREFIGGKPETTIYISESGSRTLLEAKILEDGRTI